VLRIARRAEAAERCGCCGIRPAATAFDLVDGVSAADLGGRDLTLADLGVTAGDIICLRRGVRSAKYYLIA
jgi:hypothetical protein